MKCQGSKKLPVQETSQRVFSESLYGEFGGGDAQGRMWGSHGGTDVFGFNRTG